MASAHSCCMPWNWPLLEHISSSVRTILPHPTKKSYPCPFRLFCTHKACRKSWHAAEVLYYTPALCGKSFCPTKHTTHAPASCEPLTRRRQTLERPGGYCSRCV